jgi:hypothetical protein
VPILRLRGRRADRVSQGFTLDPDEILFLCDDDNTVGIAKAHDVKKVFIETDEEELVQFLDADDLIAASCFIGGPRGKNMVRCMLYLVRDGGIPLVVLNKAHPATRRITLVVSAGETIRLSGCIVPGTHPEQDVLCGKGGMDGMILRATKGGVSIDGGGSPAIVKERFSPELQ